MGLFDKKTAEEKARAEAIRDIKKDAREDKRDARKDAREDRKDARQDKRDEMTDVRQSDLKGEAKRDAKNDVREEKRDAISAANAGKRDAIDEIGDDRAEALAMAGGAASTLDGELALELLGLSHAAHSDGLEASSEVWNGLAGDVAKLRGRTVRDAVVITDTSWKVDVEAFVARSEGHDVVVAFRGSETTFFNREGAFKDWALTDLRSTRIPYPPAPKSWPDQRWVHGGFWDAYNLVRNQLLAEVTRQVEKELVTRRIYVTGFSLGGALALLAALDIAQAHEDEDVELFTFAAPRVGDANLNNLLADRVAASTLVAFRGDPVVHLPPLGPNFPVTFKHPMSIDLGGIHLGLGNPLPQVGQQYRTAGRLYYINKDREVKDRYPMAQVALSVLDHAFGPYFDALSGIAKGQALA